MSDKHPHSCRIRYDPANDEFVATCGELAGIAATGKTRIDALESFEEVLAMFVDSYQLDGIPLPAPRIIHGRRIKN